MKLMKLNNNFIGNMSSLNCLMVLLAEKLIEIHPQFKVDLKDYSTNVMQLEYKDITRKIRL